MLMIMILLTVFCLFFAFEEHISHMVSFAVYQILKSDQPGFNKSEAKTSNRCFSLQYFKGYLWYFFPKWPKWAEHKHKGTEFQK